MGAKFLFGIGLLGLLLLPSQRALAQASLRADFVIEGPTPCVDGACVLIVKAVGGSAFTDSSDPAIDERQDLIYNWDFGNPNNPAPTWVYGSRPGASKNQHCCGSWFAHFYEGNVGTVTITLKVTDVKGGVVATATKTAQIVSQDTQFAGGATMCVNPAGDTNFTGCPASAVRHNIGETGYADWDDSVRSTMSTANRILFKCGARYTSSQGLGLSVQGPKVIGGYGANGVGSASCGGRSDAGTFLVNHSGRGTIFTGQTLRNLTIRDMTMIGPGIKNGAGDGIDNVGNPYLDLVLYHDRWRDTAIIQFFEQGSQMSANQGRGWVVENDNMDNATATNGCYPGIANASGGGGYNQGDCSWGTQLACSNCGVLGTHYGQIGSHSLRISKGYHRLLAYSTIDGTVTSSLKAYVKWNAAHAACGGVGADGCYPDCKDHDSYIGWNFLDGRANPFPPVSGTSHTPYAAITFLPQSAGENDAFGAEELMQGIIEGNYVDASRTGGIGYTCIGVSAHDSVIRNNVCNYADSNDGAPAIHSHAKGTGSLNGPNDACAPPQVGTNLKYLNNTAYASRVPRTEAVDIRIEAGHTNTRVQNNFLFGPGLSSAPFLSVGAGTNNIIDHNVKQVGGAIPFAGNGTYNSMQDFRLVGSNTTARGVGIAVDEGRVDADAMCRQRATPDLGAFDSAAVSCSTGSPAPAALEPPVLLQPGS